MRKIVPIILLLLAVIIAGCAEERVEKKPEAPKVTPTQTPVAVEGNVSEVVEKSVSYVEETINEILNLEKELAELENVTIEEI